MKRRYFAFMVIAIIVIAVVSAGSLHAAGNIKIAKIGFVGDMTGPLSNYSWPLIHPHQWAIEYINKVLYPDGVPIGNDRYHFELIMEDDGAKLEESPMAAQRALDKGIFAMLTVLGSFYEPIFPKLVEMKVPMVTASPFMTEKIGGFNYRYRNTAPQVMPATASYVIKKFNLKRPSVYSETGAMGTPGGQQWVNALVKVGVPRDKIDWQQYKVPLSESKFLSYLTKSMNLGADVIVHGATGEYSGTQAGCDIYLQAKELGFKGYFCAYTGMTDIQARTMLGPKYASYLSHVYQGEGVEPFTHPDPKVRQWGRDYFAKYNEYPIDLVPWGWDEIMVLVSAAYAAGTVTDGAKFNQALAELPFDFLLKSQLKTPMLPQRGNKLWDNNQALMEVQVAGWTEEGIKVPAAFMVVDEKTMEIKKVTYPKKEVIDGVIKDFHERKK
jgi:ABC-type branched-subunit amino acid transport system substrate-binding protein